MSTASVGDAVAILFVSMLGIMVPDAEGAWVLYVALEFLGIGLHPRENTLHLQAHFSVWTLK